LLPERIGQIRRKLTETRLTAPLFNTALYAQHIEAAYTIMYERYSSGQAPDHFQIHLS